MTNSAIELAAGLAGSVEASSVDHGGGASALPWMLQDRSSECLYDVAGVEGCRYPRYR